jgi:hypothetical protein
MTADLTCPSRATRQRQRPVAGVVEPPARARRRGCREPRITLVQQVGRAAVDVSSAAAEVEMVPVQGLGGPSRGTSAVVAGVVVLAFFLPLAFAAVVGVGAGEGGAA